MSSAQQRPHSDIPLMSTTATLGRPVSANLEQHAFKSSASSGVTSANARPTSEILSATYKSPEAEAIDKWFEDLSYYERTLEQMARARLDDHFREELRAIEQWFSVLSDPERTTALYTLLQNTTQVQIRFFVTVLQQMTQRDQLAGPLSPTQSATSATMQPVKATPASIPPSAIPEKEPSSEVDYVSVNKMTAMRNSRRLYDRHSASFGDDKFQQVVGTSRLSCDNLEFPDDCNTGRYISPSNNANSNVKRISTSSTGSSLSGGAIGSNVMRPRSPIDDVIVSTNWSMLPPAVSERTTSLVGVEPPRITARTTSTQSPLIAVPLSLLNGNVSSFRQASSSSQPVSPAHRPIHTPASPTSVGSSLVVPPRRSMVPIGIEGTLTHNPSNHNSLFPGAGMGSSTGAPLAAAARNKNSAIDELLLQEWGMGSTAAFSLGSGTGAGGATHQAAASGTTEMVATGASASIGATNSLNLQYATSEFSDDGGDYGNTDPRSRSGTGGLHHKEKGKIPESVDLEAIKDIPSWLRSLRLHKYTPIFENDNWRAMIMLGEDDLIQRGVAALGARRKMMKVFELVRKELEAEGSGL
ncbi:Flap-structured DNA-binding and RNA-binding protein [Batrachochytrium dendrobatidis]|nr:Flap-structured DNA-binding and RNA-binding protein [Batrachochytrium dendrobatidis]